MKFTRNCTTTASSTIPSKTAAPINASTSTITHFHDDEEEAQDAQLHLVERAFEADPKARSSDEWGEFMGAPYGGTCAQGRDAYEHVTAEIVTRHPEVKTHFEALKPKYQDFTKAVANALRRSLS